MRVQLPQHGTGGRPFGQGGGWGGRPRRPGGLAGRPREAPLQVRLRRGPKLLGWDGCMSLWGGSGVGCGVRLDCACGGVSGALWVLRALIVAWVHWTVSVSVALDRVGVGGVVLAQLAGFPGLPSSPP